MESDILTIKEVAEYLKVKEKTAYKLVAEGKIPGFKVGGSWRFRKQEIEEWIIKFNSEPVERMTADNCWDYIDDNDLDGF